MAQPSLIDARRRSLLPVFKERLQLAAALPSVPGWMRQSLPPKLL